MERSVSLKFRNYAKWTVSTLTNLVDTVLFVILPS